MVQGYNSSLFVYKCIVRGNRTFLTYKYNYVSNKVSQTYYLLSKTHSYRHFYYIDIPNLIRILMTKFNKMQVFCV